MPAPDQRSGPGGHFDAAFTGDTLNSGNRREDIFLTDQDRKIFQDGLADSRETYRIKLIIYVKQGTHFENLQLPAGLRRQATEL